MLRSPRLFRLFRDRWKADAAALAPGSFSTIPPFFTRRKELQHDQPPAAETLLGHLASPPPAPEDIEHARAARTAAVVAMVDSLPLDGQAAAAGLTGPLAAALSCLGRGLMRRECESAERSESASSCK